MLYLKVAQTCPFTRSKAFYFWSLLNNGLLLVTSTTQHSQGTQLEDKYAVVFSPINKHSHKFSLEGAQNVVSLFKQQQKADTVAMPFQLTCYCLSFEVWHTRARNFNTIKDMKNYLH